MFPFLLGCAPFAPSLNYPGYITTSPRLTSSLWSEYCEPSSPPLSSSCDKTRDTSEDSSPHLSGKWGTGEDAKALDAWARVEGGGGGESLGEGLADVFIGDRDPHGGGGVREIVFAEGVPSLITPLKFEPGSKQNNLLRVSFCGEPCDSFGSRLVLGLLLLGFPSIVKCSRQIVLQSLNTLTSPSSPGVLEIYSYL